MQTRRSKHLSRLTASESLKILLIDNNVTDTCLFEEAFRALRIRHHLLIAHDSAEALQLLDVEMPALILLDVNMPHGLRLLRSLRRKPKLRAVPVIVLTASRDDRDIYRAYDHGASAYVSKPLDDFADLVGDIERFWLRRARLPRGAANLGRSRLSGGLD